MLDLHNEKHAQMNIMFRKSMSGYEIGSHLWAHSDHEFCIAQTELRNVPVSTPLCTFVCICLSKNALNSPIKLFFIYVGVLGVQVPYILLLLELIYFIHSDHI